MFKIKVTDNEAAQYIIIITKIRCAKDALKPSVIPIEATKEQTEKFLNGVISIQAGYIWLEQDWWRKIIELYDIKISKENLRYDMDEHLVLEKDCVC
jgi:hypothetical protein